MARPLHLRLRESQRLRGVWRAAAEPAKSDVAVALVLAVIAVLLTIFFTDSRGDAPGPIRLYVPRAEAPAQVGVPPVREPVEPPAPVDPDSVQPPDGVVVDVSEEPDQQVGLQILLNLMITVPLVWRRRWPLACFAVQLGGLLFYDLELNLAGLLALLIGAYSVAVYRKSVVVATGAMAA